MFNGLMTDSGASKVSAERIDTIVPPEGTRSWRPISHGHVRKTVMEMLGDDGWNVDREDYALSKDTNRMFGVLGVSSRIADGVNLAVGIRNSTDKKFPAGLCAGDRVMVCDNLSFVSDVVVMHRHTPNILSELPVRIAQGIERLSQFVDHRASQIDQLKNTEISTDRARVLLTCLFEKGFVNKVEFGSALNEWHGPFDSAGNYVDLGYGGTDRQIRHIEFADPSLWKLQQCVTEVKKARFNRNANVVAAETMDVNSYLLQTVN